MSIAKKQAVRAAVVEQLSDFNLLFPGSLKEGFYQEASRFDSNQVSIARFWVNGADRSLKGSYRVSLAELEAAHGPFSSLLPDSEEGFAWLYEWTKQVVENREAQQAEKAGTLYPRR